MEIPERQYLNQRWYHGLEIKALLLYAPDATKQTQHSKVLFHYLKGWLKYKETNTDTCHCMCIPFTQRNKS